MATDWAQEQLDAYNDIKDDGVAIIVRKKSHVSYDAKTDVETGGVVTTYDTYALIAEFTDAINDKLMSLSLLHDKSSIKKGDRMLTIPAYGIPDLSNPGTLDHFDISYKGNIHSILLVQSVEPGGTAVLFKVQARR